VVGWVTFVMMISRDCEEGLNDPPGTDLLLMLALAMEDRLYASGRASLRL
jgi:hypothetical protein